SLEVKSTLKIKSVFLRSFFFFQAEDGIRDFHVTGVQTCALPICRRGFTPRSVRNFCDMIGVSRSDGMVDVAMLEHALRDDLNKNAPRAMAVLRPLKVVIENLPEGHVEMLRADYHPELDLGARDMPFTRELFINQDDFKEEYSKKFKKKFTPGNRIRLRHSYVIEATGYEKDADGNVVLVTAKLIEGTLGTDPADDIKPKGV